MESKKRVLVAMSGGVDSSVAAAMLKKEGYDVVGTTMQVWDYSQCELEEGNGTCCSSLDVDDARSVADLLEIPFYVINCEAKFKAQVIDPFVRSYLEGQTPLPCVNCNTYLKFDHLIKKMHELDCNYLATGHYAQILPGPDGRLSIFASPDDLKDQTYFLFTINPEIIPRLIFPIGHLKKTEVRKLAEDFNLPTAKKKDSQGICFVGKKGYSNFIETQISQKIREEQKGWICSIDDGKRLSRHDGIHHFTIGQCKGLGMDFHEKLFVIKIDPLTKNVYVGDEKYLFHNFAEVVEPKIISNFQDGSEYQIKIRYQKKGAAAKVYKVGSRLRIEFLENQRAITPGQAAVIYDDNRLVGGGWISP